MIVSEFYIGGPSIILNTPHDPGQFEKALYHEIYHFHQLIGSSYGLTLLQTNRILHDTVTEYFYYVFLNKLCSEGSPIEDLLPDRLKERVSKNHKLKILKFKLKINKIINLLHLFSYESDGSFEQYTNQIRFFLEQNDVEKVKIESFIRHLEDLPEEMSLTRLSVGRKIGQELAKRGVDLVCDDTAILLTPKMVVENFASFFSFFVDGIKETGTFRSNLAPFDFYEQYPAEFIALNVALMDFFKGRGTREEILGSIFGIYELSLMTDFHPGVIQLSGDDRLFGKGLDNLSVSSRFLAILQDMLHNGLITGVDNPMKHNYSDDLDRICSRLQWVEYSKILRAVKRFLRIPEKPIFRRRFSDFSESIFRWALDNKMENSFLFGTWPGIVNKLSSFSVPLVVLKYDREYAILNEPFIAPNPGHPLHSNKGKELFLKSAASKIYCTTFWEMFCRDLIGGDGFKETKKFIKKDMLTVGDVIDFDFELVEAVEWLEHLKKYASVL